MELLAAIAKSSFSTWVRESGSLWAYPAFLLLHTIGLALLVGVSSIVALLVLSSAPRTVLTATRRLFAWMWTGFAINAVSGLVLLAADAPSLVMNRVMWVKLVFIVLMIPIMRGMQRYVSADPPGPVLPVSRAKLLASAALACWLGAIVTGRLTAYFAPFDLLVE